MVPKTQTFFTHRFEVLSSTAQLAAKFGLSSLNMKTFLGWAVDSGTAPAPVAVRVLEAKKRGRREKNFVSLFATNALAL